MEFKDLLTMYFERSNALEALWGIYVTIVIGLLAFLGSVRLKPPRLLIVTPLLLAFVGFAYVNCDALRSVTRQRLAIADLVRRGQFQDKKSLDQETVDRFLATMDATGIGTVTTGHAIGDVLAIAGFLGLAFRERKTEPAAKAAGHAK